MQSINGSSEKRDACTLLSLSDRQINLPQFYLRQYFPAVFDAFPSDSDAPEKLRTWTKWQTKTKDDCMCEKFTINSIVVGVKDVPTLEIILIKTQPCCTGFPSIPMNAKIESMKAKKRKKKNQATLTLNIFFFSFRCKLSKFRKKFKLGIKSKEKMIITTLTRIRLRCPDRSFLRSVKVLQGVRNKMYIKIYTNLSPLSRKHTVIMD